jgi:hypothetical protein
VRLRPPRHVLLAQALNFFVVRAQDVIFFGNRFFSQDFPPKSAISCLIVRHMRSRRSLVIQREDRGTHHPNSIRLLRPNFHAGIGKDKNNG